MYSGENSPPTLSPNQRLNNSMKISASRKLGVARPTKPMKVKAKSPAEYWWVAE